LTIAQIATYDFTDQYAVVFDAGSSGTRVHVYRFSGSGDSLKLEEEIYDPVLSATKPGLSSYANDTQAAADSVVPMLNWALSVIPQELQATTPVMLGATAGLRLLPAQQSSAILNEVAKVLKDSPLNLAYSSDARILTGAEEGGYLWLAVNLLTGSLGGPLNNTVGVVEMGGASLQEAYAMSEAEAGKAPRPDYINSFKGAGVLYNLYVYSYLGYGSNEARHSIFAKTNGTSPCLLETVTSMDGTVNNAANNTSYETCSAAVMDFLEDNKNCNAPPEECGFDGSWVGSKIPSKNFLASVLNTNLADAKMIPKTPGVHSTELGPLKTAAECACNSTCPRSNFDPTFEDAVPYMCVDFTYAYLLLSAGLNLPDSEIVESSRTAIAPSGDDVEIGWTLGAATSLLESESNTNDVPPIDSSASSLAISSFLLAAAAVFA